MLLNMLRVVTKYLIRDSRQSVYSRVVVWDTLLLLIEIVIVTVILLPKAPADYNSDFDENSYRAGALVSPARSWAGGVPGLRGRCCALTSSSKRFL